VSSGAWRLELAHAAPAQSLPHRGWIFCSTWTFRPPSSPPSAARQACMGNWTTTPGYVPIVRLCRCPSISLDRLEPLYPRCRGRGRCICGRNLFSKRSLTRQSDRRRSAPKLGSVHPSRCLDAERRSPACGRDASILLRAGVDQTTTDSAQQWRFCWPTDKTPSLVALSPPPIGQALVETPAAREQYEAAGRSICREMP